MYFTLNGKYWHVFYVLFLACIHQTASSDRFILNIMSCFSRQHHDQPSIPALTLLSEAQPEKLWLATWKLSSKPEATNDFPGRS